MSLHVAAQHLASKGRDGDTELVHMTKGEIKGLQDLALAAGGSLSINPDTGLVEASFLKRILPMVAGAALMATGIGAPMAAGLVGGFETLRTGDLNKGLMAGLGAYGGAGLAQGLSTAGAQVAGEEAAKNIANQAVADNATTAGMVEATKTAATAPVTMGNISSGFGQLGSEAGRSAVYNALPKFTVPAAGVSLMNAATPEPPPIPGMPGEDPMYSDAPYKYRLSSNFSGYVPRQPTPYYRPTGLGYAEGGEIMMAAGGSYDDEPMGDAGMASGGIAAYSKGGDLKMKTMSLGEGIARDTDPDTAGLGAYEAAKKRVEKQYSAASLKANKMPKSDMDKLGQIKVMAEGGLGGYSDGGRMLKGPGDGMSDSIPATIGKKQPARLADGEFVVPADVVSHLGNGSTDAGAKKLYAMMDKVRQARTGNKKQGKQIKADKFLPKFADGGSVAASEAPAAVPAAAPASAPAFSYPGSGMSLADITSLGNFIARGNAAPMQATTPAPTPAPMPTNIGLSEKLAAAQANRPTVASTPLGGSAMDYTNVRPDMLIDPTAAGWAKAEYSGGWGFGRSRGRTSNVPEGAQTYTDPDGNLWFRT